MLFILRAFRRKPPAARDTQAPTQPGNFVVTLSGNTPVLNWAASTDNVAVAGYQIYASYAASPYTLIAITSALTFTDNAAEQNALCAYNVAAFDPSGNVSTFTGVQSVTTPNASTSDVTAPPVPTVSLVTQDNTAYTYEVAWPPVTDTGPGGAIISGTASYQVLENGTQVATVPQPSGGGSLTAFEIGAPAFSGSDSAGVLTGGGTNHYGTSDQFFLNAQAVQGDFDVFIEIDSVVSTDQYAKGGIAARFTSDPASPYFNSFQFPNSQAKGGASEYRLLAAGQAAQVTDTVTTAVSRYIFRRGNVLTSQRSATTPPPAAGDASWVTENTQTFPNAPAVIFVGRFGCQGDASATMTMNYSHYALTGASPCVFNSAPHSAGQVVPVTVKSVDVAGNVSAASTAVTVTYPSAGGGSNTSMLFDYSIGGTRNGNASQGYGSTAYQAQMKLYRGSVLGMYPGLDGQNSAAYSIPNDIANILAANPGFLSFGYIDTGRVTGDPVAAMSANKMLAQASYPNGALVTYNSGDVLNPAQTAVDPTDSHGRDCISYFVAYWMDLYRNGSAGGLALGPNAVDSVITGPYLDDIPSSIFVTADWLRNGNTNTTTQIAAVQAGFDALFNAFRAANPGQLVCANTSQFRGAAAGSFAPLVGSIDIGIMEAMSGDSWSHDAAYDNISAVIAGYAREKTVLSGRGFGVYGACNIRADGSSPLTFNSNGTVATFTPAYQGVRYEAAKCRVLTDNLLFPCSCGSGSTSNQFSGQPAPYDCNTLRWFGFFAVDSSGVEIAYGSVPAGTGFSWMGAASEAAQTAKRISQGSLGVFYRLYANGIAVFNPRGNGIQSVTLPSTYKRLNCSDDSTMTGGSVTSITLQDGDGFFGHV